MGLCSCLAEDYGRATNKSENRFTRILAISSFPVGVEQAKCCNSFLLRIAQIINYLSKWGLAPFRDLLTHFLCLRLCTVLPISENSSGVHLNFSVQKKSIFDKPELPVSSNESCSSWVCCSTYLSACWVHAEIAMLGSMFPCVSALETWLALKFFSWELRCSQQKNTGDSPVWLSQLLINTPQNHWKELFCSLHPAVSLDIRHSKTCV